MSDQIFDLENEKVVINLNCLLVPEFKAVFDKYNGDINPFCYIHYMTDIQSVYHNDDKDFQSAQVYGSFPGNYKTTDKVICDAVTLLYYRRVKMNPIIRLFEGGRAMVNKMADYLNQTDIIDGKEGNLGDIIRIMDKVDKTITNFSKLEKAMLEQQAQTRGSQEQGYDIQ